MMRILILNLGPDSAEEVGKALAGQGYEITTESELDVEQIEMLGPELLITEATPSDLSCCGIITQIKAREKTKSIRVLMVVQGGALERARALDLGADDVISSPFEPLEFAARVRTRFRERQPEEQLRTQLKQAEAKEHLAELAVETLSGGAVTRKRIWVLPAILALCVVAVIAPARTLCNSKRKSRGSTAAWCRKAIFCDGRKRSAEFSMRRANPILLLVSRSWRCRPILRKKWMQQERPETLNCASNFLPPRAG